MLILHHHWDSIFGCADTVSVSDSLNVLCLSPFASLFPWAIERDSRKPSALPLIESLSFHIQWCSLLLQHFGIPSSIINVSEGFDLLKWLEKKRVALVVLVSFYNEVFLLREWACKLALGLKVSRLPSFSSSYIVCSLWTIPNVSFPWGSRLVPMTKGRWFEVGCYRCRSSHTHQWVSRPWRVELYRNNHGTVGLQRIKSGTLDKLVITKFKIQINDVYDGMGWDVRHLASANIEATRVVQTKLLFGCLTDRWKWDHEYDIDTNTKCQKCRKYDTSDQR